MPKIPYKAEKCREDDEDYEIVSFEDFCDKPPGTKTDLLTLNDNINYRLHYESDKGSNFADGGETSTRDIGMHTETSLNGPKNASYKRKLSFAPFGRTDKSGRGPLFSGVIPKPRNEGESREHRYERFSPRRGCLSRTWEQLSNFFPGMVATALLCALCVGAWWAVGGALGGGWGDDHYRRLYERTHADDIKKPLSPIIEKIIPTENRYHDHNNLSTKNKNLTDFNFKKDNKKSEHTDGLADMQCENITDNMRFDCYPQSDASEENCAKRGCCWALSAAQGAPYCFYPKRYETYRFVNSTENKHGLTAHYARARDAHYPLQFNNVRLTFNYLSDTVLYIKISDADNKRFEPPYPEVPIVGGGASSPHYRVLLDGAGGGFRVERTDDNVTIVNTQDVGGFILSDKFLQISSILPTDHVYGLGEKQGPLMNNFNWNTFTLFNRDLPPTENKNLYGSHPFYLALEKTGKSHGMLLLNSNAMDIVLQPTPAITYRVVGGVLQLFVLLGPAPRQVLQQLTELVGRPFMPPYWALGFHLSKFNYGSLNVTRDVMQKNIDAGIPLDAQWNDLDYMRSSNDFTYDTRLYAGLPQYVRDLHHRGLHYVILVDPGQSASEKPGSYPPFDRGLEMNVFVKNSTNQPFVGKVWNPQSTVWPDFTHPNASSYWKEMLATFHQVVPFDGAWIDMNEPSNFLSGSMYGECAPEELPYTPVATPREGLRYKTLCMDAKHYAGEHYDVHNLYALAESIHTFNALAEVRGRRPFVLSRASSPGAGHVAAHWGGDVYSKWHDLKMSVPALLSFSLFGIPMMGSDICGFIGNTTEELCTRWSQLGAFYPFSRNHNTNDAKPQDPVSLGPRVVSAAREALRTRYRLLPYYYTLFWNAHVRGDTVARPLFFEFPNITKVHAIDEQFLLGPHVMVSAILQPGNTTTALFPEDSWYSLRDGRLLAKDKWMEIGEEDIVSVRAGAILPLQEPPFKGPVSTSITRSRPLQLLVVPGADGQADGQLYWDDGDSINTYEEKKYSHIDFVVRNNELRAIVQWWGHGVPSIDSISILGQKPLKSLTLNDSPARFTYTSKTQVVVIPGLTLDLDKPINVKWTYQKSTKL